MDTNFDAAREAFLEGVELHEQGQYARAEARLLDSLALLPGRASTLANLGMARLALGRPQQALEDFDASLAAEPADADTWCQHGIACTALGRHGQALASLEQALLIAPQHLAARYQRAATLHKLGQTDHALQATAELLADTPEPGAVWSLRGQLLRELKRDAEAAQAFEQAIAAGHEPQVNGYLLAGVRGHAQGNVDTPAATPEPYLRELFDGYAEHFDLHLVQVLHYRAHEAVAQAAGALHAAQRRGPWRAVLDLGCGTGLCGTLMRPVAQRVDGVDLSPPMLAQAQARGAYETLTQADIAEHLQRTTQRYDLIVSADVFIYIGDLRAVFAGVQRVLEPGGAFVFSLETGDTGGADFRLLPSLRYAHAPEPLLALAAAHGLQPHAVEPTVLREEFERPVEGLIVTLVMQA